MSNSAAPACRTRGKTKSPTGNWRRPPDQATTTLVLNLDTTAPGVAERLEKLYFTMYNLRRALQRDAQSLARQYWAAKEDRDTLGWKPVSERLGINRSASEARARTHFQNAGWASDHVSAALVSHMAAGVFENLTRHLWSDTSGKRQGPLRVTPYRQFATITGRARSHTTPPTSGRPFGSTARSRATSTSTATLLSLLRPSATSWPSIPVTTWFARHARARSRASAGRTTKAPW